MRRNRYAARISRARPHADVAARLLMQLTRQVFNTGYSGGGASTRKNYSRGWDWRGGSPIEDINKNLDVLRQRSRDLYMNSAVGRAAIERINSHAVGLGLGLQATPNATVLGLSSEEASEWARRAEWEFGLWANTRECDALGLNTFGELQAVAMLSWLQSGDCFALLPMRDYGGPYELKVHLIEADRVQDPDQKPQGLRIENGVEIAADGRTAAYWVGRVHPLSATFGGDRGKFDRVPVRDADTGKLLILHMLRTERPEQRRGVPLLAPIIEDLKQLSRYSEAELMAAVVAGLFTVFIKSQTPQTPLGEALPIADAIAANAPDTDFQYELGPGAVIGLAEGEDIAQVNPLRPNSGFDSFVTSVSREIGAAISIPYEVLLQSFTASYSASRAALLAFWKTAHTWRNAMVSNFCQPIYEELLWEAVLKGRILAPGFVDDPGIRAAWLDADWNGPAMGQIDPLKEVQAAEQRMKLGVSTLAREAMELTGSDWETNVAQRGVERQAMLDAGLDPDDTGGDQEGEPIPPDSDDLPPQ